MIKLNADQDYAIRPGRSALGLTARQFNLKSGSQGGVCGLAARYLVSRLT
jgi:hypothetical protein